MKFKQFLSEMPHFGTSQPVKVECPYKGHKEGPIDSTKNEWSFDFGAERSGNTDFYEHMQKSVGLGKKPNGIIPMYCKHDEKVFMHNFDTGESWPPSQCWDKSVCSGMGKK